MNEIETKIEAVETEVNAEIEKAESAVANGLTDTEKLVIREAQLMLTKIENEFRDLQSKAREITQAIEKQAATAAQRLGLDIKDFVLDIETLVFKSRAALKAEAARAFDAAEKVVKI